MKKPVFKQMLQKNKNDIDEPEDVSTITSYPENPHG
jgi:hypothetical protein